MPRTVRKAISRGRGRSAILMIDENNRSVLRDGATGHGLWALTSSRVLLESSLDAGAEPPRFLSGPADATICRVALPIALDDRFAPPIVRPVSFPKPPRDPRLSRPLPWSSSILGNLNPLTFPLIGLGTLVVLAPPWLLVRWATRRRKLSVRLLTILPIIAALLLAEYHLYHSYFSWVASAPWYVAIAAFAYIIALGLPVLAFVRWAGISAIRPKSRGRFMVVAGPLALSFIIASVWIATDYRHKIIEEYYDIGIDACEIAMYAAYLIGAFLVMRTVVFRPIGRVARWVWRRLRRASANRHFIKEAG